MTPGSPSGRSCTLSLRSLRFGHAGLPDTKDLVGSIKAVVEGGYAACEVQFVKEFTLKEPEAKTLGDIARDHGVALSVHAPYFAQLTTKEPDRLKLHLGALHHACKLGSQMGATVIVCHPGSKGDASSEELNEQVDSALTALGPRVADLGVKLGLETCGRKSQYGSLGDIALQVGNHAFATVVVDYGHVHALSNGSLTSPEAMRALFSFVVENFGPEHLWPLHTHFSDNRFGPAGELSHVPYGEGTLRIGNVLKGVSAFDIAITVISEQKEAASHSAILKELKSMGAPLVAAGPKEKPKGGTTYVPYQLELDKRSNAHFFVHAGREVRLTSIDKVLFPDDGITKLDLASYYFNVAPLMAAFLKDRPVNMQRVPEGIYAEAFYEKQCPKGAPHWVKTVPVKSQDKTIDFVVVDDASTLVWLAQIASVEVHAWTSKWPKLDEPDFAVLDLDPHEPIEFEDVRTVAKLVKVLLDKLGLKGFPKTSGGSGIQIFIPLVQGHTYPEVRAFCSALGGLIRSAYPEKVTLEASKPKRAGKVYIDANQNAKSKTLVAPYSVRPYPGAPVSAPVTWEELDEEFFPEQFNLKTIFERIERVGDPFKPAMTIKQDIRPALAQLSVT
ncbi:MAG: non-homologous end-joining DNA ligase [Actinomycetota bacterium]|nr:non-homologous end-joining DNA ligase [Actinomycetota bacterium]